MKSIAVITAITDGVDELHIDQPYGEADWFCYTDVPIPEGQSGEWYIRPSIDAFRCPVRNSRISRHLPHLYHPEYEFWIWIDGVHVLKKPPEELIQEYMGAKEAAFMNHENRDCVYDEIKATRANGKYMHEIDHLQLQAEMYERVGMPRKYACWNTSIIFRRNTPRVVEFNKHVFEQLCRFCKNDQTAAPFSAWQTGIFWAILPGQYRRNDLTTYLSHKKSDAQQIEEIAERGY